MVLLQVNRLDLLKAFAIIDIADFQLSEAKYQDATEGFHAAAVSLKVLLSKISPDNPRYQGLMNT